VSAIVQNVQLDISSRRFRSALAGAQRLVNAQPESSDCWFWLGEAYRSLGPRQEKLTENERTPKGQRASYEHGARLTEQEEFNQLAAAAEGRAVLLEHQAKAAECYRKAALLNPQSPHPALGLGMLYEQQGKGEEAMAAYKQHLEIAPQSPERARVEGRLKALATGGLK
jgi:tetratricopeptide (TPR) repeat protein